MPFNLQAAFGRLFCALVFRLLWWAGGSWELDGGWFCWSGACGWGRMWVIVGRGDGRWEAGMMGV